MPGNMTMVAPETRSSTGEKRDSTAATAVVCRFYGHQIVYPGQGGTNPCWFCKCVYRGRFTLQMGCLLLGCVLCIYGIVFLVVGAIRIEASVSGVNVQAAADASINNLILTKAVLMLSGGVLFLLLPGAILIIASLRLNKKLCFVYSILMVLGMLFFLIESIVTTVLATKLPLNFEGMDFNATIIALIWAFLVLDEAFRLYAVSCGYGLFLQIRGGEYDMPSPPYIASTYAISVVPNVNHDETQETPTTKNSNDNP